ncbi:MAG TPA: KTSC domain-containing protein [Rhizomicrobium sp.]|nr:KTSC domain-containing protein [Rhizomicrobium sp.]
MPALDSAALLAVHYDYRRKVLRATFRESRRTYDYFNVSPLEYAQFLEAKSKGAWFNARIRDHYPFAEVKTFGRRQTDKKS